MLAILWVWHAVHSAVLSAKVAVLNQVHGGVHQGHYVLCLRLFIH